MLLLLLRCLAEDSLHRTVWRSVDRRCAALGWGGFIFGISGSERFNLNSIWGSPEKLSMGRVCGGIAMDGQTCCAPILRRFLPNAS